MHINLNILNGGLIAVLLLTAAAVLPQGEQAIQGQVLLFVP